MQPSSPAGELSVSIIVPLYNEEENLPLLVETIFREFGTDPALLELVLVDDGSRDKTAELALELAQRDPRIRLIQHEHNRGLGGAIRTGLKAANGDLVFYTDADLPFDFSLIPKLVSLAGRNRLVTGYRLNRGEGARRWVLTKGYNFLIHALFGLRVHDVNFACKIIPRRLAQSLDLQSEGSFIDAEILLEARRQGVEIIEHPLVYYPRLLGESTLSRPAVIFVILRELARYIRQSATAEETKVPLLSTSPFVRYSLAFLVTLCGLLFSSLLHLPLVGVSLLFAAGVAVVSLYGGWKPGLLTAVLSILGIDLFLTPPIWALTMTRADLSRAGWFGCAILLAVAINALRKMTAEETTSWSED
ncbi:MAG TPA: glycosyltransferase [Blastocatellia bacterium]|nr:glycosyltransferase [Blastocatellia bacterium]HMZ21708.1 glycosyltransferase [Blastocatellia bacterium]HNG34338.1 glycosyltransferase [Blastocatellia bacterium]